MNPLSTILIFAISLNELLKLNIKTIKVKLIFITISLVYLIVFSHFIKYIKLENQLNFNNAFDLIVIFYPFLIIIILFIFFKYFWNIGSKLILLFLILNIVECFILIKKFHSHTFFIKKNNIEHN